MIHRFRETGHTGDDAVAADEQRQQHLFDGILLTYYQLAHLLGDVRLRRPQSIGERNIVLRFECYCFFFSQGKRSFLDEVDKTISASSRK